MTKGKVYLTIKPHFHSDYENTIVAYILPNITSQIPSTNIIPDNCTHLEGLQLADPHFKIAEKVDLLLGASNVYANIILEELVKGSEDAPITQHSIRLDYLRLNY